MDPQARYCTTTDGPSIGYWSIGGVKPSSTRGSRPPTARWSGGSRRCGDGTSVSPSIIGSCGSASGGAASPRPRWGSYPSTPLTAPARRWLTPCASSAPSSTALAERLGPDLRRLDGQRAAGIRDRARTVQNVRRRDLRGSGHAGFQGCDGSLAHVRGDVGEYLTVLTRQGIGLGIRIPSSAAQGGTPCSTESSSPRRS